MTEVVITREGERHPIAKFDKKKKWFGKNKIIFQLPQLTAEQEYYIWVSYPDGSWPKIPVAKFRVQKPPMPLAEDVRKHINMVLAINSRQKVILTKLYQQYEAIKELDPKIVAAIEEAQVDAVEDLIAQALGQLHKMNEEGNE